MNVNVADLIGYAIVVGIPVGLFILWLLGRINYDGRGPTDLFPPGFD